MKSDVLIGKVMTEMQSLDSDQMELFVKMMTTILLSVMRGINDNQFVIDYLTAAINDNNPPIITPHLKQ